MKKRSVYSSYFTTIKMIFSLFPNDTHHQGAFVLSVGGVFGKHALDTISFPGSRGSFRSTRMASKPLASREPLRCQFLSLQSMVPLSIYHRCQPPKNNFRDNSVSLGGEMPRGGWKKVEITCKKICKCAESALFLCLVSN